MSSLLDKDVRSHGFQYPPHPLQLVAWIVLVLISVVYFTALVPHLVLPWRYILYATVGVAIFVSVLTQFVATILNPIDPSSKSSTCKPLAFNRASHKHVIELSFCHICSCRVSPTSKHCRPCNKCVINFDHHCRWLNNCVGSRNYKWFFAAMTSSMLAAIIVTVVGVTVFVAYYTDAHSGAILTQYHVSSNTTSENDGTYFHVLFIPVQDEVWQTVTFICTFLALVTSLLLIDLFSLHVFLCLNNLTTFEFLNPPLHLRHIHRCSSDCCKKSQVRVMPETSPSEDRPGLIQYASNDCNDNMQLSNHDNVSLESDTISLNKNSSCHKQIAVFAKPSLASDLDVLYSTTIVKNNRKNIPGNLNESADIKIGNSAPSGKLSNGDLLKLNVGRSTRSSGDRTHAVKLSTARRRKRKSVREKNNNSEINDEKNGNETGTLSVNELIEDHGQGGTDLVDWSQDCDSIRDGSASSGVTNDCEGDVNNSSLTSDMWLSTMRASTMLASTMRVSTTHDSCNSNGAIPIHITSPRKQKRSQSLRHKPSPKIDNIRHVYTIDLPAETPITTDLPQPLSRHASLSHRAHLPPLASLVVPHLDLSYLRSSAESISSTSQLRQSSDTSC